MATVVNSQPADSGSNGSGFLVGVILLVVFAFLFFVYLLPRVTGGFGAGTGGASVNLPSSVNVQSK